MDLNGLRDFRQTLVVRGIAQGSVDSDKNVYVRFVGTTIKCRADRGISTAAGDVVLAWRTGFEVVVVARLYAAAPSGVSDDINTYPPNPWTALQTGKTVIYPIETRSYRDDLGWRSDTDDLLQGKWGGHNHAGCAFYGKKPRSLAGVEVTRAFIKVKRDAGSTWSTSEPITLKRITQKTRPKSAGPDFVSGTVDGPHLSRGEQENFTIPDLWAQSLVDGDAGGLAIHTNTEDPKARLDGRHSWSPSFAMTIEWRRVI